jgi:hypothetical protein
MSMAAGFPDDGVERSAAQLRVLRAVEAYPFDLGSVYVRFGTGGGVEVSVHGAPPEQVAVLAVLLGVTVDADPDPYSAGPIRFGGGARFRGGVTLDWYPAPAEPRPEPEHRLGQWAALAAALSVYEAG